MSKNNSILLITNDELIIKSISENINNYKIIVFKNIMQVANSDIIILDDYKIDTNLLPMKKIINISKNFYKDAKINIKRPFLLSEFISVINRIVSNKNIIQFKKFSIINDTLIYDKNKEIVFGSKEIELIKYLFDNKKTFKTIILKDIWNLTSNSSVVENTVSKIKQKMKSVGIDKFIECKNKEYFINPIYE